MRVPGAIYEGKDGRKYLAIYNFYRDLHFRLPGEFSSAQYIAHVSYKMGNKTGGINIFTLPNSVPDPEKIAYTEKKFRTRGKGAQLHGTYVGAQTIRDSQTRYDIRTQIASQNPDIQDEIISMSSTDIVLYCKEKYAKNPEGPRTEIVPRIIPKTQVRYINPGRILTGGKQLGIPSCALEANVDYMKSCISAWVPGPKASFDGKNFTDYWAFPWGECPDCYAEKEHFPFPKNIYKHPQERFEEELRGKARLLSPKGPEHGQNIKVLRFGKLTDPYTEFTRDYLLSDLETMLKTKTRGVITTKFMPFDLELADLLKRTKSVALFSHGWDPHQKGFVLHNQSTEWLTEQMLKYRESGVFAIPYLQIFAHQPIGPRERKILDLGIPIQLLPYRFKRKTTCLNMCGDRWEDLKGINHNNIELFDFGDYPANSYEKIGQYLVTRVIHSDWLNLIGNNNRLVRMCHHNSQTTYCGSCFLKKGFTTKTVHVKREKTNSSRPRRGQRAKKPTQKNNQELFKN